MKTARLVACGLMLSVAAIAGPGPALPADEGPVAGAFRMALAAPVPRGIKLAGETEDGGETDAAETGAAAGAEPDAGDVEPDDEGASAPTFTGTLEGVGDALTGKSLAELIEGTPRFSPIEGLPDSVWKDRQCSTCHEWTQETLCTQGEFYVKQGTGAVDRKEHPYGGGFKTTVMRWADGGCPE